MRNFLQLVSIVLLVVCSGCAPQMREYTAAQLAELQAKEIEGTVVKQSRGSFVLKDGTGEEKLFRTGELTQYLPADYRSLEGDTVRVTYQEIVESAIRMKRAVLQLTPVAIPEKNKPLSNPIEGEIIAVGKGSSRHARSLWLKIAGLPDPLPIYIPFDRVKIQINGKEGTPVDDSVVGAKASVDARRMPIFRGNAYLYEADRVVLSSK